ncbi:hypothetical protein [Methanolobus sp. ZRKC5]|uniref:hypothetical protein n=1 Tax=unclassified Methanolobus TaxID=2629569 RepID=UPI00313E2E16
MNEEKEIKDTTGEKLTFTSADKKKEKKERTQEEYFRGGMLLLVGIIIAIASFQFYFIVNDVIYTWFKSQYVPLVRAFYNLAVIGIGLYILKAYILKKEKN